MRRRWTRGGSCRRSRRAISAARPTTTRSAASACIRRGSPGRGLSYAQAAARAIELGGKYDGHELPADINAHHEDRGRGARRAGADGRGEGHLSARRQHLLVRRRFRRGRGRRRDRQSRRSSTISAWPTSGTVINPRSLGAQIDGGSCLGIGHALCQKWVYDPQYGLPLAKRFHHNKPLTILDIPATLQSGAVDLPDPETPVGARGVGEPPVGAGYGAVMNAIADAVGVDVFRRAPVTPDIVLMSLEHAAERMHEPLQRACVDDRSVNASMAVDSMT